MKSLDVQYEKLSKGFVEVVPENSFRKVLEKSISSNSPLNIKYGIDPTSTHIHLGFTVGLRKLKQFQDFGHNAIIIIGDYTATIGDPSGKNSSRPRLSHEDVLKNSETYLEQCFKILDRNKTKVVYNSSWFSKMSFSEVISLLSKSTVSQMLERLDFKTRYEKRSPIYIHEFIYPLMQGFDSVIVNADIEIGGTDQKFNVLRGRELQQDSDGVVQIGMFLPILLGICGKEKMSKSLGNVVGIDESPEEMFHKIYNIPDTVVDQWISLLSNVEISGDILEKKVGLALEIVSQYYGKDVAEDCLKMEREKHTSKHLSKNLESVSWKWESFKACLMECGNYKSGNELKNALKNRAIKVDGLVISDFDSYPETSFVLSIGKNFIKRIEK